MSDDDDSQTNQYPVDPLLTQAVQQQESGGDPNGVSSKGAVGTMQTLPSTLKNPGYGVTPAKDDSAAEKQRVGEDYLQAMHDRYGDQNLALMAYNWGPNAVDNWIANGQNPAAVPAETKDYVQNVNAIHQQLQAKQLPAGTQVASNDDSAYGMADSGHQPLKIDVPNIHDSSSISDDLKAELASRAASAPTATTSTASNGTIADDLKAELASRAANPQPSVQNQEPPVSAGRDIANAYGGGSITGVNNLTKLPTGLLSLAAGAGSQLNDFASMPINALVGNPQITPAQRTANAAAARAPIDAVTARIPTLNQLTAFGDHGEGIGDAGAKVAATVLNKLQGGNLTPEDIASTPTPSLPDAKTSIGKIVQTGAEALPGGLVFKQSLLPTLGATYASNQVSNDNPLGQLAAGMVGGLGGKAVENIPSTVSPNPLPRDTANALVKADQQGIKYPMQVAITGQNIPEKLAGAPDLEPMRQSINKSTNDLMGANDNGEGHTAVNKDSVDSAFKNNIAEYDKLSAAAGPMKLENHYNAISDLLDKAKSYASSANLDKFGRQLLDKIGNGTLTLKDIKDLNGYNSPLSKVMNGSDPNLQSVAEDINNHLDQVVKDNLTPEQAAQLDKIDNRYRFTSKVAPVADTVQAGQTVHPEVIRNIIQKNYEGANPDTNPIKGLGNTLSFLYPDMSKVSSTIKGAKTGASSNGLTSGLGNAATGIEAMQAITGTNPLTGLSVLAAQKGGPIIVRNIANKFINSDFYKQQLLKNANYLQNP